MTLRCTVFDVSEGDIDIDTLKSKLTLVSNMSYMTLHFSIKILDIFKLLTFEEPLKTKKYFFL